MKPTEKQMNFMNRFMGLLETSEDWESVQLRDPCVKQSFDLLEGLMAKAVADDKADALWDAVYGYANTLATAAMLYGIRSIDTIRTVAADPVSFSQYMLGGKRK